MGIKMDNFNLHLYSEIKYTEIAIARTEDYQAHAELMLAGTFAHNDLTGIGNLNSAMDGACHALEQPA